MILADSSVWIDHFRHNNPVLLKLLGVEQVLMHPYVVLELALGSLHTRTSVLADLDDLPAVHVVPEDEVRVLVERRTLFSRGIDFVDIHLLASAALTEGCRLWTFDRRLDQAASDLGCSSGLLQ
jgi:predicted nucleic acid-binding protein